MLWRASPKLLAFGKIYTTQSIIKDKLYEETFQSNNPCRNGSNDILRRRREEGGVSYYRLKHIIL